MSKLNWVLLIIVIILAAATALVWFKPDVFSSISWDDLNPFKGNKSLTEISSVPTAPPATTGTGSGRPVTAVSSISTSSSDGITVEKTIPKEPEVEEEKSETLFEKDIKQRQQSFQTKVFTYEPYQLPVARNPFQREISSIYFAKAEERFPGSVAALEDARRFEELGLPPGTKYSGTISSGNTKLAIVEVEDETYIVKEGDLILEKYSINSIETNKVVIEINGNKIPLTMGGEEAGND